MLVWKNTETLDGRLAPLSTTKSRSSADIALMGSKPIELDEFSNLKGIFRVGISKSNVPISEAKKRGIRVQFPSTSTVEHIYEETANFTVHLIFRMLYNDVGSLDPWKKYDRDALVSRKLLVIGMGNIGSRVYSKLEPFMEVVGWDIEDSSIDVLRKQMRTSDCVTLHIPETEENRGFIDAEKLSWMDDGSVLINTARGPVVSEQALYEELRSARLKAAFDVFWEEPYSGRLKDFHPERFHMTPHVASTCNEFLDGSADDLKTFVSELSTD